MRLPLISVILPVYNHEHYVLQALQSVLDQTYPAFEVIVIDDGSTDLSRETIEKFLQRLDPDKRQKIQWLAQPNQGAHHTLNRGLKLARGDYLTILNSDDYYHPERLAKLKDHLVSFKGELIFSRVAAVDQEGCFFNIHDPWHRWYEAGLASMQDYPGLGFALLKGNLAVSSGNLLFSRELFEKVGFFSELQLAHDLDFLLRAVLYTEPLFLDVELYFYRFHGTNTTWKVKHLLDQEMQMIYRTYLSSVSVKDPENHLAPSKGRWPYEFSQLRQELGMDRFLEPYIQKTNEKNCLLSSWHLQNRRWQKLLAFAANWLWLGLKAGRHIRLEGSCQWPAWLVYAHLPFRKIHWHLFDDLPPNAFLPGGLGRLLFKKSLRKKKLSFSFESVKAQKLWKKMGVDGPVLGAKKAKAVEVPLRYGYLFTKKKWVEAEGIVQKFVEAKRQKRIPAEATLTVIGFSDPLDLSEADFILKMINSGFQEHIHFRKEHDCSKIDILIENLRDLKEVKVICILGE